MLLRLVLHRPAPRLPASALAVYLTCGAPPGSSVPPTPTPMVQGLHEGRDATCTAAPDQTPTNLSSCAPPCSQLPGCPQFPAFIRHVFSPGTQTWPFLRLALHTCCPAKVPRAPLGRCFPRELRKEHRCLVARTLAGPPRGPVALPSPPVTSAGCPRPHGSPAVLPPRIPAQRTPPARTRPPVGDAARSVAR